MNIIVLLTDEITRRGKVDDHNKVAPGEIR